MTDPNAELDSCQFSNTSFVYPHELVVRQTVFSNMMKQHQNRFGFKLYTFTPKKKIVVEKSSPLMLPISQEIEIPPLEHASTPNKTQKKQELQGTTISKANDNDSHEEKSENGNKTKIINKQRKKRSPLFQKKEKKIIKFDSPSIFI